MKREAAFVEESAPRCLRYRVEGAGKTVVDGGGSTLGWTVSQTAVIASFTIQNTTRAIQVSGSGKHVRLVDLVLHQNAYTGTQAGGIHVTSVGQLRVVGCTLLDNRSTTGSAQQLYLTNGTTQLINTAIYGASSSAHLWKHATNATLVANHSLVKGYTLSGTGNLSSSTDPRLRFDGRLLHDSPLRAAGGATQQSKLDLDLEARPGSAPDIGADQFVDTDEDDLADQWELAEVQDLLSLTGLAQDADSDGLHNEAEYGFGTRPTDSDSDDDGVSDGSELTQHSTDPLDSDSDDDDMPDGWEITNGLDPLTDDRFDDLDGDRYPNVFEWAGGADPQDEVSKPSPTYTVDPLGGGDYTTVNGAVGAAATVNGSYQVIELEPGIYSGAGNVNFSVGSTKPTLLIIGKAGAAETVIDGGTTSVGWSFSQSAVVASLTFRHTTRALNLNGSGKRLRLVDLVIRNNASASTTAGGVHLITGAELELFACTLLENTSALGSAQQLYLTNGATRLVNTVVYGASSAAQLWKHATNATLVANYSLVKGYTLSGTGNLSSSTEPRLRFDGRLLHDSPLRAAGGATQHSKRDLDLELRPSSTPDIGADQFVDSDADDLADRWELLEAEDLETLTGRTQDEDSDGLDNEEEYARGTRPTAGDSDGDGLNDGQEVGEHSTDPLDPDSDDDAMPDGWEVDAELDPLEDDAFDDADGDRYPNVFEHFGAADPRDLESKPAPTYVVDPSGAGTHTTINSAVAASNAVNGSHQIIHVAPGTYSGVTNLNVTLAATKPTLLILGTGGARATVIDGGTSLTGWTLSGDVVLGSLTFQRTTRALWVSAPGKRVRLNDLVIFRNHSASSVAGGVYVAYVGRLQIVGTTLLENSSALGLAQQLYLNSGATQLINSAVWGSSSSAALWKHATNATLEAQHSYLKGESLSGVGNIDGSLSAGIRFDARLLPSSPLRGAGASGAFPRVDMELEPRPGDTPDIGADQIVDLDDDDLPDAWELEAAAELTVLDGVDFDADGLQDVDEYATFDDSRSCDPLDPDTDGDGALDGDEVEFGTNPLAPDADELATDHNGDGIIDAIGTQLGFSLSLADDDGDGLSNEQELALGTDPLRVDSDGDLASDLDDPFPLDPWLTEFPADVGDFTPPVITLFTPAQAQPL